MPSESRGAFLLLRRRDDLDRAIGDLGAYLSLWRRRSPATAAEVILGVWIDEDGVANLPTDLTLPDPGGGVRRVRILETTGVNGIWMLCWLETPAHSVSRADLVAALLDCFGHEAAGTATPTARFLPVYAGGSAEHDRQTQWRSLDARYPGLLLPPMQLDGDGILRLPPAQAQGGAAPA